MTEELTSDQKFIVRQMFIARVLRSNGSAFQDLFWSVMCRSNPAFAPIRPQGAKGDGGNDGYIPSTGEYFQVYGPIDPEQKADVAAAKLADDFDKLTKSWSAATPITTYRFVFNDKWLGIFPPIAKALTELTSKSGVNCSAFAASELENRFMDLKPDDMVGVLDSVIPDPERISNLDYGILREVIQHIMAAPAKGTVPRFGELPTVEEKVQLAHLSDVWRSYLVVGARLSSHIDGYFAQNSNFAKQELQKHVVQAYASLKRDLTEAAFLPSGMTRSDIVFGELREVLLPANATLSHENALNVVLAYFFETCDIFDPLADSTNASAVP